MAIEIKNNNNPQRDTGLDAPSLDTGSSVKFELPLREEAILTHQRDGGSVLKRGETELLVTPSEPTFGVGMNIGRAVRYNPAPDLETGSVPMQRGNGLAIVHARGEVTLAAA